MSGRSAETKFYRQRVADIELSLERATDRVPHDGNFYVVLGNEVKGKFRGRNEALKLYRELLRESGYRPPPSEPTNPRNEIVERYLDQKEAYWGESHRHARRGGKGRF